MSKRKISTADDPLHHDSPEEGMECIFCCDEITSDNYVEYQKIKGGDWFPSIYCESCIVNNFINIQWNRYLEQIAKADCAAALKRVITAKPPQNVKDKGLPCEGGDNEEVAQFWTSSNGEIMSAKLVGSLTGNEREKFWKEKKDFLAIQEQIEQQAAATANDTNETSAESKPNDNDATSPKTNKNANHETDTE